MRSIADTGRGGAGGNLRSFSLLSFPLSFDESPKATGYEGPMVATRGAQGATLANNVSAGSQRGFACACLMSAIATLCREGFKGGRSVGGGCVRMWWKADRREGSICGVGRRFCRVICWDRGGGRVDGRCLSETDARDDCEYGTWTRMSEAAAVVKDWARVMAGFSTAASGA